MLALTLASGEASLAQEPPTPRPPVQPPQQGDLTELSIEDLMKVEITTAAKKEQKLIDAPYAVYVILPEDLRRSGARTIPDALRMVPGLQVAELDANKWAVSARGFNGRFANKLLVLMDGRSVYTPLFSGVYWDVQDTMLEDVERIEVIRGPGATMWGANAVNGVINVITKPASETQGVLAVGGIGTEWEDFASARYGGAAGDEFHYRAYGKYANHDSFITGHDDWFMSRAGFRTDWKATDAQTIVFLGDVYDGQVGEQITNPTLTPPFSETFSQRVPVSGANLLGRWTLKTGEESHLSAQAYYETTLRLGKIVDERRNTVDVSVDHRWHPIPANDVVWGGEFRFTRDQIDDSPTVQFDPTSRDAVIASGFLQDEITIVKERLRFTAGCKFEYNSFSRAQNPVEAQPSGRLAWTPDAIQAIWASASKAVRTPSRAEADGRATVAVQPTGPTEIVLVGNRSFMSEDLIALELGYRIQPMDELSIDAAAFYNLYDNLRTFEPGAPFLVATPVPHVVQPLDDENRMSGRTRGVEVSIKSRPLHDWRLQLAYTFLQMNLVPDSGSLDPQSESAEHESPVNQVYLRSSWDLPSDIQVDVIPRYVSALSALDVEAYVELDARLAWRPSTNVETALVGQNLLHRSHFEFAPSILSTQPTPPERSTYLMLTVRF